MSNEKLIDILNSLADVGLKQGDKHYKELASDFIKIKLRYQMRKSGMSNKQIKFEIDRIQGSGRVRSSA